MKMILFFYSIIIIPIVVWSACSPLFAIDEKIVPKGERFMSDNASQKKNVTIFNAEKGTDETVDTVYKTKEHCTATVWC